MLAEIANKIQHVPFSEGELQDIARERIMNLFPALPQTNSGFLALREADDPERNMQHFLRCSI